MAEEGTLRLARLSGNHDAIDVVLLDIDLPKITGRDALRKIKNENPDVKVVIASGYLEPNVKSEIDRAGVKYSLSKPYRPDEVVRTLPKPDRRRIIGAGRITDLRSAILATTPARSHIAFPISRKTPIMPCRLTREFFK